MTPPNVEFPTSRKIGGSVPRTSTRSHSCTGDCAAVVFVEFDGYAVPFMGDGWFNATVAAKRYRKRVDNWLRLAETKEYMAALTESLTPSDVRELVRTQEGRTGGTWLHPKLGVVFARWCDVRFAVWCDQQIDHILRGGLTIWDKAAAEPSTTSDREVLLTAAAALVARHRLPFSTVYRALNVFSGVVRARDMTCGQVLESSAFAERLLRGIPSTTDYSRLASLGGDGPQLRLTFLGEQS